MSRSWVYSLVFAIGVSLSFSSVYACFRDLDGLEHALQEGEKFSSVGRLHILALTAFKKDGIDEEKVASKIATDILKDFNPSVKGVQVNFPNGYGRGPLTFSIEFNGKEPSWYEKVRSELTMSFETESGCSVNFVSAEALGVGKGYARRLFLTSAHQLKGVCTLSAKKFAPLKNVISSSILPYSFVSAFSYGPWKEGMVRLNSYGIQALFHPAPLERNSGGEVQDNDFVIGVLNRPVQENVTFAKVRGPKRFCKGPFKICGYPGKIGLMNFEDKKKFSVGENRPRVAAQVPFLTTPSKKPYYRETWLQSTLAVWQLKSDKSQFINISEPLVRVVFSERPSHEVIFTFSFSELPDFFSTTAYIDKNTGDESVISCLSQEKDRFFKWINKDAQKGKKNLTYTISRPSGEKVFEINIFKDLNLLEVIGGMSGGGVYDYFSEEEALQLIGIVVQTGHQEHPQRVSFEGERKFSTLKEYTDAVKERLKTHPLPKEVRNMAGYINPVPFIEVWKESCGHLLKEEPKGVYSFKMS